MISRASGGYHFNISDTAYTISSGAVFLQAAAFDALAQQLVAVDSSGRVRATNWAWRRFRREAGLSVNLCAGQPYAEAYLCDVPWLEEDAAALLYELGSRAIGRESAHPTGSADVGRAYL